LKLDVGGHGSGKARQIDLLGFEAFGFHKNLVLSTLVGTPSDIVGFLKGAINSMA
jgi:hypothetical protein